MREPLNVVVTTLNNAATLEQCLASVAWADDIVLLDSGSSDATLAIAAKYGARIFTEPFKGYSAQKQSAIDKAAHRWVLLLDADEALAPPARAAIEAALVDPKVAGFRLPRREQVFWTFNHRGVRLNAHLRLFDRQRVRMNAIPVHAAPDTREPVVVLAAAEFVHHGEPDIHTKVSKINAYSTGLVAHKRQRRQRFLALRLTLYPAFFFLRQYIGKRWFLDGWAGFINAVSSAYYVFLKYAKLYEATRQPPTP
ncbi:glycosyltransferase family 2 protein [Tahibacter amnicola]|uniref:Glycosyltransferase family 2 protein n=1 Tax=Tahibacter amnicola TaxID=2976241 RepID=A0ABY6BG63_9GAMM|nr:glycosyltransferase family 2 protein [Tahibacter amnicola]UXI69018.1 glycosyltransferase family 2 protein [Tahibacter amnicola]